MLLLLSCCLCETRALAFDVMLPKVYDGNANITGWLISEKLDGVRGYWNGKVLLSKHGTVLHPPSAFTRNFPPFALEGEIWGGRGTFEQTVGVIKKQKELSGWLTLKFAIFDVPTAAGGFLERLEKAKKWFSQHHADYAFIIPQKPVKSKEAMEEELRRVESLGGEGLIVRSPDALYAKGRDDTILKVKSYRDMEGVVTAYIPGTGKNKGRLGSMLVKLPDGKRFKIGTGFTDEERENPPPLGTTITFKYYGFYQSGIPKFPSFLRIRADKSL